MPVDPALTADCGSCTALCCIVLPFDRSSGRAGFAFAKAAGERCRHLLTTDGCGVHDDLAERGMGGCVAYDCLGAGQYVVARHGSRAPTALLGEELVRIERLHELLVLLDQAIDLATELVPARPDLLVAARALRREVTAAREQASPSDDLWTRVGASLDEVSRVVRSGVRGAGAVSYRHADLAGRDLRATDLAGADLRGALLIGADLRGAVLDRTDLLGADLRDADLRGADLSRVLFATRPQLARARRS